jgi:hypothetical protein
MLIGIMVKNEAASIAETIASLRKLAPAARIVVFDTGSDDATAELARSAGAEVRTDVAWAPSGRYDDSYNAMLEACEAMAAPDEWIFHGYGRRVYEGTWAAPDDASLVSSTEHWSEHCDATRVVAYRANLRCRYRGATHERLHCPPMPTPDSGVRMRRHSCDHPRPDRFERDLALLEGQTDPRSRFYYAQTLACLGRLPEAYAAYLVRADMQGQGDDNEVAVSLIRALQMMPRHPTMLRVAKRMCFGALAVDPDRGEPWLALAEFCLHVGRPELAKRYAVFSLAAEPNPRALFVDPSVPARAERLLAHVGAPASANPVAPAA